MASAECIRHWWREKKEKKARVLLLPQNEAAIDTVAMKHQIPKDDLFTPRPDELIIHRVKKGEEGEVRWNPGLPWRPRSWLPFWHRFDTLWDGTNFWDTWSHEENSDRSWEEVIVQWNDMARSKQLPVIFLIPKDPEEAEYLGWEKPAPFAVIRTSNEVEIILRRNMEYNTLRVIPLHEVVQDNDIYWEVDFSDSKKNRIAQESGITRLFRRFDVVAQRSTL